MSFESEVRGVLYERWRKILRFAQNDKRQRAQNNRTEEKRFNCRVQRESGDRKPEASLTRSF